MKARILFVGSALLHGALSITIEPRHVPEVNKPPSREHFKNFSASGNNTLNNSKRSNLDRVRTKFGWPDSIQDKEETSVAIILQSSQGMSEDVRQELDEKLDHHFGEETGTEGRPTWYCAEWEFRSLPFRPFCVIFSVTNEHALSFIEQEEDFLSKMAGVFNVVSVANTNKKLGEEEKRKIQWVMRQEWLARAAERRANQGHSTQKRALGNLTHSVQRIPRKMAKAPKPPGLQKRDTLVELDLPFDVRVMSTPPPTALDLRRGVATYGAQRETWLEASQGEGINIYLLDSGFVPEAKDHPEFAQAVAIENRIKGWLHHQLVGMKEDDHDRKKFESPHGTGALSKILGKRGGFAKKANVWMAPFGASGVSWEDLIMSDQLSAIRRHNLKRRLLKNPF
ncbi:hypothetical protein TWF281_003786 [Arthrobotrys megalospora]